MRRSLRGFAALACACLAIAQVPAAVSAGGTAGTIWVDGDGMAGPNNCDQATAAPSTVQAGIDMSLPGDRVLVCPGDYVENLVVNGYAGHDGLQLISTNSFKAHIISPNDQSGAAFPGILLALQHVNNVRVQWFVFKTKVWSECDDVQSGIAMFDGSTGNDIRANNIRPSGKKTYDGACHLFSAIRAEGPNTENWIRYNLIKDWIYNGVDAVGGAKVHINRNSFRLRHATYTGGDCMGVAVSSYDALIRAKNNQINEPEGDHPCPGTGFNLMGGKAHIWNNTIDGMDFGIIVTAGSGEVRHPEIYGNTIMNTALYGKGIWYQSGSGGYVHDNTVNGNNGVDCQDDTSGSDWYGLANRWEFNTGDPDPADIPDGICSSGVKPTPTPTLPTGP